MRPRFFLAIAAALTAVLGLNCALIYAQLGVPTRSTAWSHEINQKKFARAASIERPKLLLVGGSATLFGVQAELIEQTLNYPTVNMGTHAGLGSAYMLHMAKQAAKPGDTVIIAFEYNTYMFGLVRRDGVFVDYLLARDPGYFHGLPITAKFEVAMMTPLPRLRKGLKNRFKPEKPAPAHPLYNSAHISVYGDQLKTEAANRPRYSASPYGIDGALAYDLLKNMPVLECIREFVSWARANDVRVFAMYPNIMDHPDYQKPRAKRALQRVQKAYADLQVPIIGTFKESLMRPDAFLDTYYHLTREGAREHTEQLIPHLKAALGIGEASSPSAIRNYDDLGD